MAWNIPTTWVNGVLVSASDLNSQIRDNLAYLKGQAGVVYHENALELAESAAPASPAAGFARLFAGNAAPIDGVFAGVDNAGVVHQMVRYAEGTFTPTFGGTTTNGTITHTTQTGRYQRIMNWCRFSLRITISTISVAPTGTLVINGLPFPSAATTYAGAATIGFFNQLTLLAGTRFLGATIASGVSQLNLVESPSAGGATNLPATALAANAFIVLQGEYEIA